MSARLFSGHERKLTFGATALIVAIGLAGVGLAAAARVQQSVSAEAEARQEVASWLVPVEEFRTDNGSYAGMSVDLLARYGSSMDWTGARIVIASRERYCIERDVRPVVSRAGSLAPIVSGPCTRAATLAAPLAHDGVPPDLPAAADLRPARGRAWFLAAVMQLPMPDFVVAFPTRRSQLLMFAVSGAHCPKPARRTLAGHTVYAFRPCSLPSAGDIRVVTKEGSFLAELTRAPMQGYWLEHGGSFQGASSAKLHRVYGSAPWLGLHPSLKIVIATRRSYCATISYRGATVSLHGPNGPVTIADCA